MNRHSSVPDATPAGSDAPGAGVRRRSFLASVAAVGSLAATTRPGVARQAFGPLGRVPLPGAKEVVTGEDGTVAYVAVGDGFAVVDVGDGGGPAVRGEHRDPPLDGDGRRSRVWDLSASGDRLVTAGPAHGPAEDEFAGFVVYDVSDPSNPERVAVQPTDHAIHNCFLDGDRLYLTGSGKRDQPLVAWDLAGDAPEKHWEWSVVDVPGWRGVPPEAMTVHDVSVREDTAYVAYWDVGTWVLDVSDPANPTPTARIASRTPDEFPENPGFVETIELPGNSHYARPSPDGALLAVNREARDSEETERDGGPGGVTLWDLTATPPAYLTTLAPPTVDGDGESVTDTAHNFGWRGRRLYTSWYRAGVRVYDLSSPADPRLMGAWADPAHTSFWAATPARDGFVATSALDPSNPKEERREGAGAAVYAFPEPSGDRVAATVDRGFVARAIDPADLGTTTTTDAPTAGGTATGGQAGFTALAALCAGGVAVARLLCERDAGD